MKYSIATQAGVLVAAAALAGWTANTFGPWRVPWRFDAETRSVLAARSAGIDLVAVEAAAEALRSGTALFLDARDEASHSTARIPWSVSVPWSAGGADRDPAALFFGPEARLIVYCRDWNCDEALLLARHLQGAGHGKVGVLHGGFDAWTDAGMDIERGGAAGAAP